MTKLSLHEQANAASYASGYLATATAEMKNTALIAIAEAVETNSTSILDLFRNAKFPRSCLYAE